MKYGEGVPKGMFIHLELFIFDETPAFELKIKKTSSRCIIMTK